MASINNLTAVYADRFYLSSSTGVSEISDTYATKSEVTNSISGAVSQTEYDSAISTLQSKDIAYNNTLTTHIGLLDTHDIDITANTDAIAILDTKNLQNFNNINAINTDLTNNYQTNTVLATNFYNKTEIDTTFSNYYTTTQVDSGFYTQSYINTNIYTKTEVDGLVGTGGGYTDIEIDSFLSLKEDKSRFTDNINFFPVIDCSRPTVLHTGITIKHKTISIDNQDGQVGVEFNNIGLVPDDDKLISTFKNSTSYLTLQGDKLQCYDTSDDAEKALDLNPNGGGYKMNGSVIVPTGGLTIDNQDGNTKTLEVKNTVSYFRFNGNSIDCFQTANNNGQPININGIADQYVKIHSLFVDATTATPSPSYRFDVNGDALFRNNIVVNQDIKILNDNTTIERYVNSTKANISMDVRTNEDAIRLMVGTATDTDTNTYLECDKTNTKTIFYKDTDLRGNLNLTSSTGDIQVPVTGMDIVRASGDANYNLRIRDTQGVWEFRNRNFRCMNPSNPANGTEMILHDTGGDYRLRIGSTSAAQVGIGVQYNASYFLNVGGLSNFNQARVATDLEVAGDINLTTDLNLTGALNFDGTTANINDATDGLTFYKASTDASNVMTVANDSGKLRFRSGGIDSYNANDTSAQLLLNMNNSNAVRCNKLGVGSNAGVDTFSCVGGNAYFNCTCRFDNIPTFNNSVYINNNGRIFQRADANNSLNVISTEEINFSLQSNRTTDPTTGTIALQLNDTNGITINRAVVNNQTFSSIGKITAEADLDVWGGVYFQHSSAIKETLNGSDYDLDIRNGDTDRAINFIIGTIGSTPELSLSESKVKINNNLEITQETIIATYEQIQFVNTDSAGEMFFYFGDTTAGNEVLEISPGGVYIDGTFGYSSDFSLKENIKEVDCKKCYEIIKYVKPKTFNFIHLNEEKNKVNHLGFIAQDIQSVIPREWEGVITTDNKGHKRLDYCKTAVITHGALQHLMGEYEELKDLVKTMKKEIATMKGELTKLRNEISIKGR